MPNAQETLDLYFPEMRWRCLSLAADLDRVQRSADGASVLPNDVRLQKLQQAIQVLLEDQPDRAQRVQMIFSDTSPPPSR
jgi:hypothetical protein